MRGLELDVSETEKVRERERDKMRVSERESM